MLARAIGLADRPSIRAKLLRRLPRPSRPPTSGSRWLCVDGGPDVPVLPLGIELLGCLAHKHLRAADSPKTLSLNLKNHPGAELLHLGLERLNVIIDVALA